MGSFIRRTLQLQKPVNLTTLRPVVSDLVNKKISDFNNWYTRIIGLDEVKLYQDRVVTLQEKLLEAQEKRRDIGRQLAEIRKKSNQLQDEIHKTKRQDNLQRFLDLMKEETEVLQIELDISRQFQDCDQLERELFTAFTNAVRDSHEKQRAQLEYTKYFGLVLSIAGSFLAFCYSTLRKHDLKCFIEDQLKPLIEETTVDKKVILDSVVKEINRLENSNKGSKDYEEIYEKLNTELNFKINEKTNEAIKDKVLLYVGIPCAIYAVLRIFFLNN